ncbi:unnamed protein product [Pieris macdunnoughi]|uniref:Uncharacterized protein n=1 Tax=Pieris macdunnoughi TaxID=345717 RepID=A0A821VGV5_9NEOP|nr:unnamed protein product [Pieris macdunnoughi]
MVLVVSPLSYPVPLVLHDNMLHRPHTLFMSSWIGKIKERGRANRAENLARISHERRKNGDRSKCTTCHRMLWTIC